MGLVKRGLGRVRAAAGGVCILYSSISLQLTYTYSTVYYTFRGIPTTQATAVAGICHGRTTLGVFHGVGCTVDIPCYPKHEAVIPQDLSCNSTGVGCTPSPMPR